MKNLDKARRIRALMKTLSPDDEDGDEVDVTEEELARLRRRKKANLLGDVPEPEEEAEIVRRPRRLRTRY